MDLAIGLVIFNPAKTRRIIMNYLYTVNEFRRHGFPVFTLELCFGDSSPDIADSIVVRGNSYMFHKERLCRLLEQKIPSVYTKIAFIDADILFDSPVWYSRTSELLEMYDVVQPFETCQWLDLSYTKVQQTRQSFVKLDTKSEWDWNYHVGFAWAFRRDWYRKAGFFDFCTDGSGDSHSVAGWLKRENNYNFISVRAQHTEKLFNQFIKLPKPRISYLRNMNINHLYHGSRANRQYYNRTQFLSIPGDLMDSIYVNNDGVFEWKYPLLCNQKYLDYFKDRNDDDLSI